MWTEPQDRMQGVRKAKSRAKKYGPLKCVVCGWDRAGVHGHHVIPVGCGGDPGEQNVILLCPNHHAIAHKIGHEIHRIKGGWSRYGIAKARLIFALRDDEKKNASPGNRTLNLPIKSRLL